MQIDFHHAVTYRVERLTELDHRQADIAAYCSHYVDDAANGGAISDALMTHRFSMVHDILPR